MKQLNERQSRFLARIARKYRMRIFYDKPYRHYKPYGINQSQLVFSLFLHEIEKVIPDTKYVIYGAKGYHYTGLALKTRAGVIEEGEK